MSDKINTLNFKVQDSTLWENKTLRRRVILEHAPACLVKLVGEEQIFRSVPENYLRAIFGAKLSSDFVYRYGLDTNEFSFIEFLQSYDIELRSIGN